MPGAGEGQVLALAPVLDVTAAGPLREQLLALRGGPVDLDASAVERLGGLCLQVLMAARRTWATDGQPLRLGPASPAFASQLAAFGAPELQHTPTEGQG